MDQQIEQKNKNKFIVNAIIITAACVALAIGIIVAVLAFSPSNEKLEISNTELKIESYELDSETHYTVYVKGTAKNIGGKNYSYASVEFSIYDANNYNLGTAIANINNLADGDTWQFNAMLIGDATTEPTTFKLVKITAF